MSELEKLNAVISQFANLTQEEFDLSKSFWQYREYKKGEIYNAQRTVCKYLGFVVEGVFRSYLIDEKTAEERNVFLYPTNNFVVTFKSFIHQIPCDYHTQALADSKVMCIGVFDLLSLYKESHAWERFGRLVAQEAFNVVMERNENYLFKTPEERYIELMEHHPDILNNVPLYHIASYLGIQNPSLSRIRKRISGK